MDLLTIILLIIVNVLGSNALAYLGTTGRAVLPVKPFNCYGCLAFWLTLIFGTLIAWTRNGEAFYLLLVIALLSGLLNYLYVKSKYIITNEKARQQSRRLLTRDAGANPKRRNRTKRCGKTQVQHRRRMQRT